MKFFSTQTLGYLGGILSIVGGIATVAGTRLGQCDCEKDACECLQSASIEPLIPNAEDAINENEVNG